MRCGYAAVENIRHLSHSDDEEQVVGYTAATPRPKPAAEKTDEAIDSSSLSSSSYDDSVSDDLMVGDFAFLSEKSL